jgi:hypothetical protein
MPMAAVEKPAAGEISDASKDGQPLPTRDLSAPTVAAGQPGDSQSRPDMGQTKP